MTLENVPIDTIFTALGLLRFKLAERSPASMTRLERGLRGSSWDSKSAGQPFQPLKSQSSEKERRAMRVRAKKGVEILLLFDSPC